MEQPQESELQRATRHLRELAQRVDSQQRLVDRLRLAGREEAAREAQVVLENLQETLRVGRAHMYLHYGTDPLPDRPAAC
jgi:hypothetical protein